MGQILGDCPSLALQAWIFEVRPSKPEAQAKDALKTELGVRIELKKRKCRTSAWGCEWEALGVGRPLLPALTTTS